VTRVAVVGGAGFIGRALVRALRERGCSVVVVDVASAADADAFVRADIADPSSHDVLARAFTGAAAVVHLASRVDPPGRGDERKAMRALHIDGTRHVLTAAQSASVPRFVLASSATVYGAWPENGVPLDESAPLRPNPELAYAVDKADQERLVASSSSGLAVLIARPAIVYGAGARNYLTEIIRRAPFLPALDGRRPQLQFVHVDDVARALAFLAAGNAAAGAYNVASRDWLALEDVADITQKRIVDVPTRLAGPVVDALAPFMPPHLRAPSGIFPYLTFPFVVTPQKLLDAGWAPAPSSSAAALRSIL
jgi:nucleoside-diphosphate-sugar epimerase